MPLKDQHVVTLTMNNKRICGAVLNWLSSDEDYDYNLLKMCCYCFFQKNIDV